MSTDLTPSHPKLRPIPETRLRQPGRATARRRAGETPSVMPVDRLYLQAQPSVSDVFPLHPIALFRPARAIDSRAAPLYHPLVSGERTGR
jgi:hypothetical protein